MKSVFEQGICVRYYKYVVPKMRWPLLYGTAVGVKAVYVCNKVFTCRIEGTLYNSVVLVKAETTSVHCSKNVG